MKKEISKLIEDNHNLIYSFMSLHSLDPEEYYDLMAMELCKAAKNYNEELGAFSTCAYTYMNNALTIHRRKSARLSAIPSSAVVSLDDVCYYQSDSAVTYKDVIESPIHVEEDICAKDLFTTISSYLKSNEREIFYRIVDGYKQVEIAHDMGISQQRVHTIINRIRAKITKYVIT